MACRFRSKGERRNPNSSFQFQAFERKAKAYYFGFREKDDWRTSLSLVIVTNFVLVRLDGGGGGGLGSGDSSKKIG
ncbi:hypothetical protein GQ457_16G027130 [Hibiscus cannabinus]